MTIDFTAAQTANTVAAGPASGAAAVPTMRSLVFADFDAAIRAAILADVICNLKNDPSLAHQWLEFSLSDDGAAAVPITTTGLKFCDRTPAFEFITGYLPRASCLIASTSGPVTIDIKFGSTAGVGGTSIFSTKLTIDQGEYTSLGAVQPVLTTTTHVDDQEMSILCDAIGTGVTGLKVKMFVRWL